MTGRYAAIVLAGGGARRLGGQDKPALPVAGRTMLARVLAAVAAARPRIVVGPPRPDVPDGVLQVCERPPGGGPVAALAAGLAALAGADEAAGVGAAVGAGADAGRGLVAVLAADLPFLAGADVAALSAAAGGHDGAVLVDADGRPQWLCGMYRVDVLERRLADLGPPAGQAVRRLVAGLDLAAVARPAANPPPWYDCDTEDDYRRAKDLA